MNQRNRTWYQLSIVVAFVFILFFSSIVLVEKTGQHLLGAVIQTSGTNATLTLFDEGDSIKTAAAVIPDIEVNNLFNGTSNVYFYANYTNSTGQSMIAVSGTACAIEFEAGAVGQAGPFAMIANTTFGVWEYNRSFANNGTFMWNVTCENPTAGTQKLTAYDSVRIFSQDCLNPSNVFPNFITNNTVLCGGALTLTPPAGKSVFAIQNNNITLDCNFTIMSGANAEVGINVGSYNGTIIKNCIFENYTIGINNTGKAINMLLLFNNSFANLTGNALNLTNIQNLTLRSNNFTNSSGSAISIENITNTTILGNYFCNNRIPTISNTSANYTATNNTFCVNLINPINNSFMYDVNFTFSVSSLGFERVCNVMINHVNASGKTTVSATNENAVNLTINTSMYVNIDKFTWKVNCTDNRDNTGISLLYNLTYRACTVPTAGMSIPPRNITLCPGTYGLNTTGDAITQNTTASGIICNNTIIQGNGSGSVVSVNLQSSDSQIKHCIFNNFENGIVMNNVGSHRFKIINNTFQNLSGDGVGPVRTNNTNITNNSFVNVNRAVWAINSHNNTIANNYVYNASRGMYVQNATATSIVNNNFTNITGTALQFDTNTPLSNATPFNYTVTNNFFCGISTDAIWVKDYSVSRTLDGIITVNTFCNSTSEMPNGAVASVLWTVDSFVFNNTGSIEGSDVVARTKQNVVEDIETTNATGGTSMVLEEFNITADKVVLYKTPHEFIANASGSTKTRAVWVNASYTNQLGTAVHFNLSDPDARPNIPDHARAATIRAVRAAAQTAQQAVEQQEDKEEKEEEEEIVEIINYTYVLNLKEIILNNEVVYTKTESVPLVFKDYESYTLLFIIENNGTGNISNIQYSLDVPASITVRSSVIDKSLLQEGETAIMTFKLDSADIQEATDIIFTVSASPNLSLQATLRTILEQGKGILYSTRQKIIEETQAIITKTYEVLFLLFLIPILLLLRATTIADEKALRSLVADKKVGNYWRIYVPEETYLKYNVFQNLRPIKLEDADIAKANQIAAAKKITYQLATAVVFAQHCLLPRIFTYEELSSELRHHYPRIHFTSPARNYREDQMKRYIEQQQGKGFTNTEIRETLLAAHWSKEIVKKYLPPENDIHSYIAEQHKKGISLADIRQQLLTVKWDNALVEKLIPAETVAQEYIISERRKGRTNAQITKALEKIGWNKKAIAKLMKPENDVKAFITFQRHRGFSDEHIKEELLKKGWKQEIVDKSFSVQ